MTFPLWAVFGLMAAFLSAAQMLAQEKFRTPPFAMAFWNKAACAVLLCPFVLVAGLPHNPFYYLLLILQSLLWVVSDVVFYRCINQVGAAIVSRLMPVTTIASFFLWFMIAPADARDYMAQPVHSAVIFGILCLLVFFAWRLKECQVTRQALRTVWFVLFAAIAGSLSTKYITKQADIAQGIYSYVFIEALIMLTMWLLYYAVKRPVNPAIMFGWPAIRAGIIVGVIAACAITSSLYAVYHIDNPAYVSAVRYMDSVLILGYSRLMGRETQGNVWAGLGIVACAGALIIVRSGSQ